MRLSALVCLVALTAAAPARGEVRLPSVIGHNMVLQRDQPVPLWGWAAPGERVTVTLAGETHDATMKPDGEWSLRLPARPAGGPFDITVSGQNTLTLTNVLFGDVWLCSGQSNMGYGLRGVASSNQLAGLNYPAMRQFFMHIVPTNTPQRTCIGAWRPADPVNVKDFCAVGFWFAERLQQDLKVPIGLIWASHGSSSGETWIPREALMGDPDFDAMFEREKRAHYPTLQAEYAVAMSNWQVRAEEAARQNLPPPAKPQDAKSQYAYILRHAPGNTFNGGISPLIPFGLRGVLWYQGEHNAPRGYQYRKVLPLLIHQWRTLWGQGDFPFLIVQLPNYGSTPAQPRDSEWAELREAQALTARTVTNCGYAVTIDIGDPKDIHPRNKWDVGKRLALLALGTVYGRDIPYSGPVFENITAEDASLRLRFQHVDGGLMAGTNGLAGTVRGFAVAGEDRRFVWADARLDGDTVIVSSADVPAPVAVRYAWANSPDCNLYNRAGLPAAPFRTDDWPGCTVTNR